MSIPLLSNKWDLVSADRTSVIYARLGYPIWMKIIDVLEEDHGVYLKCDIHLYTGGKPGTWVTCGRNLTQALGTANQWCHEIDSGATPAEEFMRDPQIRQMIDSNWSDLIKHLKGSFS